MLLILYKAWVIYNILLAKIDELNWFITVCNPNISKTSVYQIENADRNCWASANIYNFYDSNIEDNCFWHINTLLNIEGANLNQFLFLV